MLLDDTEPRSRDTSGIARKPLRSLRKQQLVAVDDEVKQERQTGELEQRVVSSLTVDREITTGQLPVPVTTGRMPVVIIGAGKKGHIVPRLPAKRSLVTHLGVVAVLLALMSGMLVAVLPTERGNAGGVGMFFLPLSRSVSMKKNETALIAAQAATATAVTHDGYEYNGAGGKYTWAGVPKDFSLRNDVHTTNIPVTPPAVTTENGSSTNASGSAATNSSAGGPASINIGDGPSSPSTGTLNTGFYNPFTPGQCTYWADYEYHRLSGNVVTWSGNANIWAAGAANAGWVVSSVPHVPSIVVLQGGVQGAGYGTGHVAVVERINDDGTVATTNWNVVGWGVFSWGNYHPGAGVSFIWHN